MIISPTLKALAKSEEAHALSSDIICRTCANAIWREGRTGIDRRAALHQCEHTVPANRAGRCVLAKCERVDWSGMDNRRKR